MYIILQCQSPCSVRPIVIITTVTTTLQEDGIVSTTTTTIAKSLPTGKSDQLNSITLPSDISASTIVNYCTK